MSPPADHTALFHSWLEEHRGILVKVGRTFAPSAVDAAELQQEMLLQLWISLRSYAGQAKPSTWIYRVCLNTALTWRRAATRRERHLEPDANIAQIATATDSPAERAGEKEMLDQLYTAIHALPMFDRAVMLLSLEGLAYREMAEITGLTENHVGVMLTRARKRLAEQMKGTSNELE